MAKATIRKFVTLANMVTRKPIMLVIMAIMKRQVKVTTTETSVTFVTITIFFRNVRRSSPKAQIVLLLF
jgi:hypothetical protein